MYCRMLQREHSAILSTFIKLLFVIKIFFEWLFCTGFTVDTISDIQVDGFTFITNEQNLSLEIMCVFLPKYDNREVE